MVIEDPGLCARYIATVITGVKVGPSPSWMQEALLSAGQRPINNVVDVTNYVMLELGQPLHAFDFERLRGGRIVVRRARAGERLRLIDGSEQALTPDSLVIADAEEAVAVAGVMGGAGSEVSEATTTILLEVASFDSASIRRTAAALKQRTEASTRFEKGLNPELAAVASERAMRLLLETAGGRADAGTGGQLPGRAASGDGALGPSARGAGAGPGRAGRAGALHPGGVGLRRARERGRRVRGGRALLAHRYPHRR